MCGIVGVWNLATADPTEAARLVFFSLYALQHRGQESAGIATTGSSRIQNAQPMVVSANALGELAIGHNGNCINARELRDELSREGVRFATSSDTEVVAQVIARETGATWDDRIRTALPKLRGAWSLVLLTPGALYAVRDPLGVRPLCLGRKGEAWLVA